MTHIAFLGLGAMGSRMARRLLDAGHALTVYNRSAERAAPLVAAGAPHADTPRAAVADAEVVISMLSDDAAARAVWLDETDGAAAALRANAVALECSTVTPDWIQALDRSLRDRGITLLDTPVAGSRPQAEAGQLIFLVGGPAEGLDRIRPILSAMGGAIHHVGATGAGAWMKLAVNTLFSAQVAIVAELLGTLNKAGIPPDQGLAILGELPVASPAAKGVGGLMVARKFAPMFPIDLVEKDLRYTVAAGASVSSALPIAAAVQQVFATARRAGFGDDNISGVARLYWDDPPAR